MTQPTTYTKQHYEDVARIIEDTWLSANASEIIRSLANDFADLFAADNPQRCKLYHNPADECDDRCGFNRTNFLVACGLETS